MLAATPVDIHCSTLTAIGPFQLLAAQSGTLSQILSGTRPSVQTVSGVCLKYICSLDTSAFSFQLDITMQDAETIGLEFYPPLANASCDYDVSRIRLCR